MYACADLEGGVKGVRIPPPNLETEILLNLLIINLSQIFHYYRSTGTLLYLLNKFYES